MELPIIAIIPAARMAARTRSLPLRREPRMAENIVPVLRVADARKAAEWYARLGFIVDGEHQFGPGMPIYAFLKRGDNHVHLSEHKGDATPNSLVYFYVDDVDALAAEFGVAVKDQPWGTREVWLTDPDGNRWRIGGPGRS